MGRRSKAQCVRANRGAGSREAGAPPQGEAVALQIAQGLSDRVAIGLARWITLAGSEHFPKSPRLRCDAHERVKHHRGQRIWIGRAIRAIV
jgi:hypothetical protein